MAAVVATALGLRPALLAPGRSASYAGAFNLLSLPLQQVVRPVGLQRLLCSYRRPRSLCVSCAAGRPLSKTTPRLATAPPQLLPIQRAGSRAAQAAKSVPPRAVQSAGTSGIPPRQILRFWNSWQARLFFGSMILLCAYVFHTSGDSGRAFRATLFALFLMFRPL